MKYLICLVIGLVAGAIGASSLLNATARRHAWQRGLMQVMQHDYGRLREAVRSGNCAAPAQERLWLGRSVDQVQPAFYPDTAADAPFREYLQRLNEAIAALPETGSECTLLAPAVTKLGNACDACHRQYR